MGINSYANWKRLENCKGFLIATVLTRLLDHINSRRVSHSGDAFSPKFFPTADLFGTLHPATCYQTLASDIRQSNDVCEIFLSVDSENWLKLTWENRHDSLIFYTALVQELMSVPSLTDHSWISQGVELSYSVTRK